MTDIDSGHHDVTCAIWATPLPGPDDCSCLRDDDGHARRDDSGTRPNGDCRKPRRAWTPRRYATEQIDTSVSVNQRSSDQPLVDLDRLDYSSYPACAADSDMSSEVN